MNKFMTVFAVGAVLALSACAAQNGESDYGYESEAPYASERTVGTEEKSAVRTTKKADRMFSKSQRK